MYLVLFLFFIVVLFALCVCITIVMRRSARLYIQGPDTEVIASDEEVVSAKVAGRKVPKRSEIPTNPTTGLPIIGGVSGFDASGKSYGSMWSLYDD